MQMVEQSTLTKRFFAGHYTLVCTAAATSLHFWWNDAMACTKTQWQTLEPQMVMRLSLPQRLIQVIPKTSIRGPLIRV